MPDLTWYWMSKLFLKWSVPSTIWHFRSWGMFAQENASSFSELLSGKVTLELVLT